MKNLFIKMLLFYNVIMSCNYKEKKINTRDIEVGPILRDSMTTEQLNRIKQIHSKLSSVQASTFDEMVTNFKRDLNVDAEIAVWENMSVTFIDYLKFEKDTTKQKNKEAFNIILMRSMMSSEDVKSQLKTRYLSKESIDFILLSYKDDFKPITITQ